MRKLNPSYHKLLKAMRQWTACSKTEYSRKNCLIRMDHVLVFAACYLLKPRVNWTMERDARECGYDEVVDGD